MTELKNAGIKCIQFEKRSFSERFERPNRYISVRRTCQSLIDILAGETTTPAKTTSHTPILEDSQLKAKNSSLVDSSNVNTASNHDSNIWFALAAIMATTIVLMIIVIAVVCWAKRGPIMVVK